MDDSPIGRLPGEMCQRVFEYTLTFHHPLFVKLSGHPESTWHNSMAKRHMENDLGDGVMYPHALALICRQAYLEGMSISYEKNKLGIRISSLQSIPTPFMWLNARLVEALRHIPRMISPRHISCPQSLTIQLGPMCCPSYKALFETILMGSIRPKTLNFDVGTVDFDRRFVSNGTLKKGNGVRFDTLQQILRAACHAQRSSQIYKLLVTISSFEAVQVSGQGMGGRAVTVISNHCFLNEVICIDTSQPSDEAQSLIQKCEGETDKQLIAAYKYIAATLRSVSQ